MFYSKFDDGIPPPTQPVTFGSKRKPLTTSEDNGYFKKSKVLKDPSTRRHPNPNPETFPRPAPRTANFKTLSRPTPPQSPIEQVQSADGSIQVGAEEEVEELHFDSVDAISSDNFGLYRCSPDFSGVFEAAQLGSHLASMRDQFTTGQQVQDYLNTMRIGQIDLLNMLQWATNGESRADEYSRFTVFGVAAKMRHSDASIQDVRSKVSTMVKNVNAGPSTSDEIESQKFAGICRLMELKVCEEAPSGGWEHKVSTDSALFLSGYLYREVLTMVQSRFAKENSNYEKATVNQSHWEKFVQHIFFTILKRKEDLYKLTYCMKKKPNNDGLINVYDAGGDDYKVVDSLIEFMICVVGKKKARDEALWIARATATVAVALKKARRSCDPDKKRRAGESFIPLSYFARTLGMDSDPAAAGVEVTVDQQTN